MNYSSYLYSMGTIMDKSIIKKFFLLQPLSKCIIEWGILFTSGVLFLFINDFKILFFPIINIIGVCLFLLAIVFHFFCEKIHKQAHVHTDRINKIITKSIYSKIRHPIYLSLIIMNIGIGLFFCNLVTIILSILFSISTVLTALYEEKYLSLKFPDYLEYKKSVRWRMIPYIF